MTPYLLFSGEDYYPSGGWDDYRGSFATVDEARDSSDVHRYQWAHIVDSRTAQIVLQHVSRRAFDSDKYLTAWLKPEDCAEWYRSKRSVQGLSNV